MVLVGTVTMSSSRAPSEGTHGLLWSNATEGFIGRRESGTGTHASMTLDDGVWVVATGHGCDRFRWQLHAVQPSQRIPGTGHDRDLVQVGLADDPVGNDAVHGSGHVVGTVGAAAHGAGAVRVPGGDRWVRPSGLVLAVSEVAVTDGTVPLGEEANGHAETQVHQRQPTNVEPSVVVTLSMATKQARDQLAYRVSLRMGLRGQVGVLQVIERVDGCIERGPASALQVVEVHDWSRGKPIAGPFPPGSTQGDQRTGKI
jgi:hypothetical protein